MLNTVANLEFIEINPKLPAQASVIWLHGLGADGHDFESIVPQLGLPQQTAIRFIFPHAPKRPITINGGLTMRAWFDVRGFSNATLQDEEGIKHSARLIEALIANELNRGIPAEKIILAGFSQGGAMALHVGLRYPLRLGGLLILSAFLPLAESLIDEKHPANADIPILMLHGTQDPILPLALAEMGRDALLKQGYSVEFETYAMAHSVCPPEIVKIGEWLKEIS